MPRTRNTANAHEQRRHTARPKLLKIVVNPHAHTHTLTLGDTARQGTLPSGRHLSHFSLHPLLLSLARGPLPRASQQGVIKRPISPTSQLTQVLDLPLDSVDLVRLKMLALWVQISALLHNSTTVQEDSVTIATAPTNTKGRLHTRHGNPPGIASAKTG